MDLVLLLQVFPLAVGAAISPTVLTVQILLLSTGSAGLGKAWGLAIGRTAALVVISVGGVGLLSRLPDVNTGRPSMSEGLTAIVAGAVLAVLGLREWRVPRTDKHHSRIAARLERIRPLPLSVVGFGWELVSVSTLALFIPALHLVSNAAASDVVKIVAIVELITISSLAWLAPPVAVTLYGDRGKAYLARVHDWVIANEHRITLTVTGLFSLVLLGWGTVVILQAA